MNVPKSFLDEVIKSTSHYFVIMINIYNFIVCSYLKIYVEISILTLQKIKNYMHFKIIFINMNRIQLVENVGQKLKVASPKTCLVPHKKIHVSPLNNKHF